ncbi:DNA-processing protein DprA [Oceanimonas sp. CHS3-5]|uniref:DNA-processing protein DprA n=1 Tax=Oceanimonas sp. CHS3-5 TaxID=3068186 RepID=UPI00273FC9B1|nr:DNA-processing protein DprA [Oceanimonas sp. CHS3-5]MDP5290863.1 DNA-processing protein DprA [Oceanimonas sp. CHS3-5]
MLSKTQAILLLTAYFSKAAGLEAKPLSNKEWGKFAFWLKSQGLSPEDLLEGDISQLLASWSDSVITIDRIRTLLNRGAALAIAMEKWTRAGLWVLTRSDVDYPKRLKALLGNNAPPVFFGCGNRNLLERGGIAVVGSRNTSDADLKYSYQLGVKAASEGRSIVSGGAKGIDENAMLGALETKGTAIGILANDLLRASTSAKYRKYLMNKNLALLSPFYPEAGFHAGNAMQRNRYIYCLSDAAIAVHSGTKGGTWTGVRENIRHAWVPMWIKPTDNQEAGNAALVQQGAHWLPEEIIAIDFNRLIHSPAETVDTSMDLLSQLQSAPEAAPEIDIGIQAAKEISLDVINQESAQAQLEDPSESSNTETPLPSKCDQPSIAADLSMFSLYDHFLLLLANEACSPKTVDELLDITQLHKSQLNVWLKKAIEDENVAKLSRPVRYQWANQSDMFKGK